MARPRKTKPNGPQAPSSGACVLYLRVSTRDQADEGFSLDAQLRMMQEYAAANGLQVGETIVTYESARDKGRKDFQRALDTVRREKLKHLVFEKVDRSSRNFFDGATLETMVREEGLTIHYAKDRKALHRTSSSSDWLSFGFQLVMAKYQVDLLAEETRKGMREKARQGMWPSVAPIGYRNVSVGVKRYIEKDPDVAPLVKLFFEAYASGEYSIRKAGQVAAAMGLRTKTGKPVQTASLHLMLQNALYMGLVPWNGEVYPGVHEPIVDRETFERVQVILEGRNLNRGGGSGSTEFAYRGLFTCARCGCAITPEIKKGKYIYYSCTGAKGCARIATREEEITRQIANALDGLRIRPDVVEILRAELKTSFASQRDDHEHRKEMLDAEHKRLTNALERLYLDKVAGEVPASVYAKFSAQWTAELERVEEARDVLGRAQRATWEDAVQMMELVSNSADRFKNASADLKRAMLKSMVSNSQLIDGKVLLTVRPWFKVILEANLEMEEKGVSEPQIENWLPAMDSNHD